MIRVKNNDCRVEGDPPEILADITVAMCAFFHIIGDEKAAESMLSDCITTARNVYSEGQYRRSTLPPEFLKKLVEQEGE